MPDRDIREVQELVGDLDRVIFCVTTHDLVQVLQTSKWDLLWWFSCTSTMCHVSLGDLVLDERVFVWQDHCLEQESVE